MHEGDQLAVERLDEPEGSEVQFEDVLLVSDGDDVTVGDPTVEGASVAARIDEHTRGKKVLVYKYKNKDAAARAARASPAAHAHHHHRHQRGRLAGETGAKRWLTKSPADPAATAATPTHSASA